MASTSLGTALGTAAVAGAACASAGLFYGMFPSPYGGLTAAGASFATLTLASVPRSPADRWSTAMDKGTLRAWPASHAAVGATDFAAKCMFASAGAIIALRPRYGDLRDASKRECVNNGAHRGIVERRWRLVAWAHGVRCGYALARRFVTTALGLSHTPSAWETFVAWYDGLMCLYLLAVKDPAKVTRRIANRLDAALTMRLGSLVLDEPDEVVITRGGVIRVRRFGPDPETTSVPSVILIPDGPAVVENTVAAAQLVASTYNCTVVSVDLPGFGITRPVSTYDHSFDAGADVIEDVANAMHLKSYIVQASCVNGYYALALAARPTIPIVAVVLAQTPDLASLFTWSKRTIPLLMKVPIVGQLVSAAARTSLARRWFNVVIPRDLPNRSAVVDEWVRGAGKATSQGGCNCLAGVVQGSMNSAVDMLRRVPRHIPVRCVWGASDVTHRANKTDPLSLQNHVKHATVRVLEPPIYAGHAPTLELPSVLVEELAPFMKA